MTEKAIQNTAVETSTSVDAIMAMRFPMDGGPTVMTNRPRPSLRQRTKAFLLRDKGQDPRLLIEALDNARKPTRVNDFIIAPKPGHDADMSEDMKDEMSEDLTRKFTPSPRMGLR